METKWNWFWAAGVLLVGLWGCATATQQVPQDEVTGQLSPSYHSIAVAPVKHEEVAPEHELVARRHRQDHVVSQSDAGDSDAAPSIEEKNAHGF